MPPTCPVLIHSLGKYCLLPSIADVINLEAATSGWPRSHGLGERIIACAWGKGPWATHNDIQWGQGGSKAHKWIFHSSEDSRKSGHMDHGTNKDPVMNSIWKSMFSRAAWWRMSTKQFGLFSSCPLSFSFFFFSLYSNKQADEICDSNSKPHLWTLVTVKS